MTGPATRAAVLQAQARCPVCGARQVAFLAFGPSGASALARFSCGAAFSTYSNLEIRVSRPCPVPSQVAAQVLENEAAGREAGCVS